MTEIGWMKTSFEDTGFKNQRGTGENLSKSGNRIFKKEKASEAWYMTVRMRGSCLYI